MTKGLGTKSLRLDLRSPRTRVLLAAGLAAALLGGRWFLARGDPPPTAAVQRGEWIDHVELRGEVKALKTVTLTAPPGVGELQILKLAPSGSVVKAGEVVAQFDVTKSTRTLEEEQAGLKQAQAEIERVRAQGRLQSEQDETNLLKGGFDVERWRLETGRQEILSQIQGEKTQLSLADSRYRYLELEAKLHSGEAGQRAEVQRAEHKRAKSSFEVDRVQRSIEAMVLRAPIDGMVTRLPNGRARQGFMGEAPEFREGDRAWAGAPIAELPDLSSVRVASRVDEIDRGRVRLGQEATVRVDAVPDRDFPARVAQVSPLAKLDMSGWPPTKNFDVVLELVGTDPRLRPGMSATGRVTAARHPDMLLVPAEACFSKGGRTVVYVRRGFRFQEVPVVVARRSRRQVALEKGLEAGDQVALRDPTAEEPSK
jgi:HlyD family secretion protein